MADWFVSTFTNKLDAKGRVSVPAQFRSVLASQATEGLYCIKALSRQPALTGFGEALLSKLSEQMDSPNPLLDKNYAARAFGIAGDGNARHFGHVLVQPAAALRQRLRMAADALDLVEALHATHEELVDAQLHFAADPQR